MAPDFNHISCVQKYMAKLKEKYLELEKEVRRFERRMHEIHGNFDREELNFLYQQGFAYHEDEKDIRLEEKHIRQREDQFRTNVGNFYEHEKPEDQKNGLEHEEKELENIDKHRKSTSFNSSLIIVKQVLFLSGDKEIHVGGKDSKDDTFDQVQSEPSIERLRKSFIREVSSIDRDIESYWRVIMYRKNMSFWAEHEKKRLDREEQEEDDINEEELENEVPEPDHEANDLMNPGPNNDQAQEVQEQEDVDENKQDNEHEHEANDLINPGPNDDQAQGVQEQDEQDNEHEVPEQDNEHEAGLNNDHAQGVAVEVMHVNTMFRPDVFVPA